MAVRKEREKLLASYLHHREEVKYLLREGTNESEKVAENVQGRAKGAQDLLRS